MARAALVTGGSSGIGLAIARMLQGEGRFGRLDVLVNSAGIGAGGRIEDLPLRALDLQLDVNLRGLFLVTRAAIPLLRESQGWIVNLASIAGTVPSPGLAAYGATKAAVIALTRSLNAELDVVRARAGRDDPPRGLRRGCPHVRAVESSRARAAGGRGAHGLRERRRLEHAPVASVAAAVAHAQPRVDVPEMQASEHRGE